MRVWVTRAEPGASATGARLRALGHTPLIAPLIAIRSLEAAAPDLQGVAALAFTSAAGVRAFAALSSGRALPVFAVGGATAAAAREVGFEDVADADGDGRALARLLAEARPPGPVLAPGAESPAFDLAGALAAERVEVRPLALYATAPVRPPPAEALEALAAGALDAVLLQSPSAARALEAAATPSAAQTRARRVLALSPACAPAGPGWPVEIAVAPREADLLRLLAAPSRLDRPPRPR